MTCWLEVWCVGPQEWCDSDFSFIHKSLWINRWLLLSPWVGGGVTCLGVEHPKTFTLRTAGKVQKLGRNRACLAFMMARHYCRCLKKLPSNSLNQQLCAWPPERWGTQRFYQEWSMCLCSSLLQNEDKRSSLQLALSSYLSKKHPPVRWDETDHEEKLVSV